MRRTRRVRWRKASLAATMAAEQFEGQEAPQTVAEATGQTRQRLGLAVTGALRPPAHKGHEHRDQRRRDDKKDSGDPVERQDDSAKGEWEQGRLRRGRQIARIIGVDCLDLIDNGCGGRAGRGSIAATGRAGKKPGEEQFAQFQLDRLGANRAQPLAQGGEAGPRQQQSEHQADSGQQGLRRFATLDGPTEQAGEFPGLPDQQGAAQKGGGHRQP
jgi:hypothetical protein